MHTWQTGLLLILGERLETGVGGERDHAPSANHRDPNTTRGKGQRRDNQAGHETWKSTRKGYQGKSANDC